MNWFNELFKDPKQLRNIVTGIIIIIPVGLLLLYWGVLSNLELNGNLDFQTLGFVSLVFLLAGDMIRLDFRKRSKEDFEEVDEEHKKVIAECDDIKFTNIDYFFGKQYVETLNEQTKHKYSVAYTEKAIAKKEREQNKIIRKGGSKIAVKNIQDAIENLKLNPIRPNWWNVKYRFVPFKYENIISDYENMDEEKSIVDGSSINVQPVKRNLGFSRILGLIKSTFLASAGLSILFTVPFGQAIIILATLFVSMTITAVWSYVSNGVYMRKKVKPATVKKLELKKTMREYVDTHEVVPVPKVQDKATTNTQTVEVVLKQE